MISSTYSTCTLCLFDSGYQLLDHVSQRHSTTLFLQQKFEETVLRDNTNETFTNVAILVFI